MQQQFIVIEGQSVQGVTVSKTATYIFPKESISYVCVINSFLIFVPFWHLVLIFFPHRYQILTNDFHNL